MRKKRSCSCEGANEREELQESLKPNEVKSEERRQLQAALELKHRVDTAAEQLHQYKADMQAYKQSAEQGADKLKAAAEEERRLSDQRQHLVEQASAGLEALLACEQDISREQSLLALAEEQLRGTMREQELHRLSSALRAELRDGEPCPVCGSPHHPPWLRRWEKVRTQATRTWNCCAACTRSCRSCALGCASSCTNVAAC
ncbi:hypothetical protein Q0F98_04785 [Paenibacillus amylolyticus]|nr:hypothetical protein Q0F98_04785 [Paenibacillus amylolyticus]